MSWSVLMNSVFSMNDSEVRGTTELYRLPLELRGLGQWKGGDVQLFFQWPWFSVALALASALSGTGVSFLAFAALSARKQNHFSPMEKPQ